jgi:predicted MFS family arabinose efflux permease
MAEQTFTPRPQPAANPLGVVLRQPAFVVLWLSEALSLIGDRLIMVALVTLVYDRTGSASAVGLLMLVKAIPALLLGSVAGACVDRWNRKWIMVGANLLQGLLVFWLPLAPGLTFIFGLYLALSIINQFFVPARAATLPELVPPETLLTANTLFALAFVGAIAVGPALGAWLTGRFGLNAAFYADAATFLVPAVAVAGLALPRQRHNPTPPSLGSDLRAGFAFACSQPAVLAALATMTVAFLVIGTLSVTGVIVVHAILNLASNQFGFLMSALGGGMVIGALLANSLGRRLNRTWAGLAGAGLMAGSLMLLPWSPNLAGALGLAALIGLGMVSVQVHGQTLLQTSAPAMRGRLMGMAQMLMGSATFLTSALGGWLVEQLNVTLVLTGLGLLALALTGSLALYYRHTAKPKGV